MGDVQENPQAKPRRKKSLNKHNSLTNSTEAGSIDEEYPAPPLYQDDLPAPEWDTSGSGGDLPGPEWDLPGSPSNDEDTTNLNRPPRRDHAYTFDLPSPARGPGIGVALGRREPGLFSGEVKGRDEVYRRKESGQFFYVSSLEEAAREAGLRVGDELLVVNGFKLEEMSSVFAAEMLLEQASRSGRLRISVARARLSTSIQNLTDLITPVEVPEEVEVSSNTEVNNRDKGLEQEQEQVDTDYSDYSSITYDVELEKEEGGKNLGIGIVGGIDAPMGAIGIFVKNIYPGGLAAEDGQIRVGDELLAVNGEILLGLKHSEAVQLFQRLTPGAVRLIVRRTQDQTLPQSPDRMTKDPVMTSSSEEITAPPRRRKSNTPSTPISQSLTSPKLLDNTESLFRKSTEDLEKQHVLNGGTSDMNGFKHISGPPSIPACVPISISDNRQNGVTLGSLYSRIEPIESPDTEIIPFEAPEGFGDSDIPSVEIEPVQNNHTAFANNNKNYNETTDHESVLVTNAKFDNIDSIDTSDERDNCRVNTTIWAQMTTTKDVEEDEDNSLPAPPTFNPPPLTTLPSSVDFSNEQANRWQSEETASEYIGRTYSSSSQEKSIASSPADGLKKYESTTNKGVGEDVIHTESNEFLPPAEFAQEVESADNVNKHNNTNCVKVFQSTDNNDKMALQNRSFAELNSNLNEHQSDTMNDSNLDELHDENDDLPSLPDCPPPPLPCSPIPASTDEISTDLYGISDKTLSQILNNKPTFESSISTLSGISSFSGSFVTNNDLGLDGLTNKEVHNSDFRDIENTNCNDIPLEEGDMDEVSSIPPPIFSDAPEKEDGDLLLPSKNISNIMKKPTALDSEMCIKSDGIGVLLSEVQVEEVPPKEHKFTNMSMLDEKKELNGKLAPLSSNYIDQDVTEKELRRSSPENSKSQKDSQSNSNKVYDGESNHVKASDLCSTDSSGNRDVLTTPASRPRPTTQPKPQVTYKNKKSSSVDCEISDSVTENSESNGGVFSSKDSIDDIVRVSSSNSTPVEIKNKAAPNAERNELIENNIEETNTKETSDILDIKDGESGNSVKNTTNNNILSSAGIMSNVNDRCDNKGTVDEMNATLDSNEMTISRVDEVTAPSVTKKSDGKEFSSYISLMQNSAFRSPFQSTNKSSVRSVRAPDSSAVNGNAEKQIGLIERSKSKDASQGIDDAGVQNTKSFTSLSDLTSLDVDENESFDTFNSNLPTPKIPLSPPPPLPYSPPPDIQPSALAQPPTLFASSSSTSSLIRSETALPTSGADNISPTKEENQSTEETKSSQHETNLASKNTDILFEKMTKSSLTKGLEQNDQHETASRPEINSVAVSSSETARNAILSNTVQSAAPTDDDSSHKLTGRVLKQSEIEKIALKPAQTEILENVQNGAKTLEASNAADAMAGKTELKTKPESVDLSPEEAGMKVSKNAIKSDTVSVISKEKSDNVAVTAITQNVEKSGLSESLSIVEKAERPESVSSDTGRSSQSNDAFSKSLRFVSKDEMISNVMRDYYTLEEPPAPVVEEKKKPVKPIIAQALLPKGKRNQPITASLLNSSTQQTTDVAAKDSKILVDQKQSSLSTSDATETNRPIDKDRKSSNSAVISSQSSTSNERLSSARLSDVFDHDAFLVPKNQAAFNQNESRSYMLNKYLEEQSVPSNQSEVVSSRGSVCSNSDQSERLSEIESAEYGVKVSNSAAFYESLGQNRRHGSKSHNLNSLASTSEAEKETIVDSKIGSVEEENKFSVAAKGDSGGGLGVGTNSKQQDSAGASGLVSSNDSIQFERSSKIVENVQDIARSKSSSDDADDGNVASVSAGRSLFEAKSQKNKNQTHDRSSRADDTHSDTASVISSSSTDRANDQAVSTHTESQSDCDSKDRNPDRDITTRKRSIVSQAVEQTAIMNPKAFGIRGFSEADIAKVKEMTEIKALPSSNEKLLKDSDDRRPSSDQVDNACSSNENDEEKDKINIKDSRAFFKTLDKTDKVPIKTPQIQANSKSNTAAITTVNNATSKDPSSNLDGTSNKQISSSINVHTVDLGNKSMNCVDNNGNNADSSKSSIGMDNDKSDINPVINLPNVKSMSSALNRTSVNKKDGDVNGNIGSIDKVTTSNMSSGKTSTNSISSETKSDTTGSNAGSKVTQKQSKSISNTVDNNGNINNNNNASNTANIIVNNTGNNTGKIVNKTSALSTPIQPASTLEKNNKTAINTVNNTAGIGIKSIGVSTANQAPTALEKNTQSSSNTPEKPLQRSQRSGSLQVTSSSESMLRKKTPPPAPLSKSSSFTAQRGETGSLPGVKPGVKEQEVINEETEESLPSKEDIFDKFRKLSTPVKTDKDTKGKSPASEDSSPQSATLGRKFSIPVQRDPILPSPLLNKESVARGRKSLHGFNTPEKD